MINKVILVDKNDKKIGTEFKLKAHKEGKFKLKAHKEGKLHRAFSLFIFNSKGNLLLQKRSPKKYHSGGLWTNTCCSHPRPNEETILSTHRRLKEEMGFDCHLLEIFSFIYKAKLNNDLTEYEFDHIFIGKFNEKPVINEKEVEDFKWVNSKFLERDTKQNPKIYTYWFKKCYKKVLEKLEDIKSN
ncbi:MAG: isopentenyl-diphosphate Delta-isomerase [Candidatus Staskawiczbacteria bacterium]|nr:isopentenyl-diphosphate Delta-isomerase [Candidatus Staskawiczbacteria bacterium]